MKPAYMRTAGGLVFLAVVAAGIALYAAQPTCPIEDKSLCNFVREIEGILETGDGQELMRRTDTRCKLGDSYPPGVQPDPAIAETPGVRGGRYFGHGNCISIEDYTEAWSGRSSARVRYVIYPKLETGSRDGPALVIRRDDAEFDNLLFLEKLEEEWRITAASGIHKSSETLLTNRIPWGETKLEWNGLLVDPNQWTITPYELSHGTLSGCTLTVSDRPMSEANGLPLESKSWNDLAYLSYDVPPNEGGTSGRYYVLVVMEGEAGYAIGYFWVEGNVTDACAAEVEDLISTLDPELFPQFLRLRRR